MMRKTLMIELLEDCVFSARSATEGGHESLDRVPGAALLGAVAGRLYRRLTPSDAFTAFHSGRLRYGDGLPFVGGAVAFPMPFSWHHAKEESPRDADNDGQRLDSGRVYDLLWAPDIGGRQPKQLRHGYVSSQGHWVRPTRSLRLKTAIDPKTGRAAESQLFGYDALAKGQRFLARIEADADVDVGLFEEVTRALLDDGMCLGRSRSAEYGRVRIAPMDLPSPAPGSIEGNRVTLWLLSDLALVGAGGQPTLTPDAVSLGLPVAQVVWEKTFLRARRYSPWNAARAGYGRERVVLAAGGVITLELETPLDTVQLEQLHSGIGLYREAGLGRIWVNPPMLADVHPRFEDKGHMPDPTEPSRPDHGLIRWLEAQSDTGWRAEEEGRAHALASEYRAAVQRARRALGVSEDQGFGPSRAQWGRVLEAARQVGGRSLYQRLFEGDAAIVKPSGSGWNVETPMSEGRWLKLAEWLKEKLDYPDGAGNKAQAYAHRVRELAHRVRTDIERRRV